MICAVLRESWIWLISEGAFRTCKRFLAARLSSLPMESPSAHEYDNLKILLLLGEIGVLTALAASRDRVAA